MLDFDGFEVPLQNALNAFKKFASLANFLNFFDYSFESRAFKGFYIHFVFCNIGKTLLLRQTVFRRPDAALGEMNVCNIANFSYLFYKNVILIVFFTKM